MANVKISALGAGITVTGADLVPVNQAGTTLKVAISAIFAYILAKVNVFTKNQSVATVALTDAASILTDASLSNHFTIALTATAHALANPTNLTDGMVLSWRVTNGGAYTLTFGTMFKFTGGTAPVVTSGASKVTHISGVYYADTATILCGFTLDIR